MDNHQNLSDQLSIVTVTHYSPRESYGEIAPPSERLVKKTLESFQDGIPGLDGCDHYIVYNKSNNEKNNTGVETYHGNLTKLCHDNNNYYLLTRPNNGLGPALLDGLEAIETPLVLFVEHDWELLRRIKIDEIVEIFHKKSTINSIRFNKRRNEKSLWDTIVKEDSSNLLSLCKVSSVGNHPQITRTDVLKHWVKQSEPTLPLILKGFVYHYSTPQSIINYSKVLYEKYIKRANIVRKFDNVEFILDTKYKSQIQKEGFDAAHSDWGVYLYGGKGDGPYVNHLGR